MKLQTYKKYKPSGIEWIGNIPEGWEMERLKDVGHISSAGVDKKIVKGEALVKLLNYLDIYKNKTKEIYNSDTYMVVSANSKQIREKGLKLGDVLFTPSSETMEDIGVSAVVCEDLSNTLYSYHIIRFRFIQKAENAFKKYLFNNDKVQFYFSKVSKGTTRQILGLNEFYNLIFPLPPISEQKLIADYLDKKTIKLDEKIRLLKEKKEKYQEFKKSLINETVCRGLDKSVKLKNSGIDFIGKVPEHWKIKRVKEIFLISRGRVIAQTELIDEGKYPVYSSQTNDGGCFGHINTFDYDGVYITWTTDGANAGTVFLRSGKFNCTNICGTLKLIGNKRNIDYLTYALQVYTKHNKRIDTNGAKIMSNEMMFIRIALPPLLEQKAIADYLNKKMSKTDEIITVIDDEVSKLTEFRKTLINDVVTGIVKVV